MDEYWRIINDKFYSIVKDGRHSKVWHGTNGSEYQGELAILRPHFVDTVLWGTGSALACLLSFRVSRTRTFAWSKSTGFFKFQRKKEWTNDLKNMKSDRRVNELQSGISILTDVFISALIGGSVSMFLTDFDKMHTDFARIPLVRGRSLIADELCSDFLKQYNEVTLRKPDDLQKMDKSFLEFISNCTKRQKVEDYLRERNTGFEEASNNVGIPIPLEGVDVITRRMQKEQQGKL